MIPLTTDVRIKGGVPRAVTGIIVGTLILHVVVEALIQFHAVEHNFRSQWMTSDLADLNPFDWFLSMFAHGSYFHWFGNMLFLWIFGSILEDRLGPVKFLILFVVCGFAANAMEVAIYQIGLYALKIPISDFHMKTLGASGAISGIMGLSMFRFYKAKVLILVSFLSAFWKRVSIPIWLFCAVNVFNDFVGLFSGDNVAHLAHIGGFLGGLAAGRFLGLKKESREEVQMENAVLFREARMFAEAAAGFEEVLKLNPQNALALQELGFCYWGLRNPARTSDPNVEKSRKFFERALELFISQDKYHEATVLFERLMKLFSAKDFSEKIPVLLKSRQGKGDLTQVVLTSDPAERRKIIEENFKGQYHRGVYQSAHSTLQELMSLCVPGELDPPSLEMAGETCVRVKDQTGLEVFFEALSQKGDERQTVRALTVLAKTWLRTPKQLQLSHLYKKAGERLTKLSLFDDWSELGKALKN